VILIGAQVENERAQIVHFSVSFMFPTPGLTEHNRRYMTAKAVKPHESISMKFVNAIQTLVPDICQCVSNSEERSLKLLLPSICFLFFCQSVFTSVLLSARPSVRVCPSLSVYAVIRLTTVYPFDGLSVCF
jgi:hypothetical protein